MTQINSNSFDIAAIIEGFVEAFNVNDLDRVMRCFAEEAVYLPGDGKTHRGPAEIRKAFEPQFESAFGTMRFDEHDRLVDVAARSIAIRWTCRHDLGGAKPSTLSLWVQRIVVGLFVGDRFGWEGLDVFHFNEAGLIVGKFTYANASRPQLRKDLGVPLSVSVLPHKATG